MDKEAYVQRAADLFAAGYNCSQSVAGAFADVTELPQETILRLSAPFGGGFSRLRDLCGAVSGMGLIMGLLYGSDDPTKKTELYGAVQPLAAQFQTAFGSVVCAEILRLHASDEHSTTRRRTCADCVRAAAAILADELEKHEHV